MIGGKSSVWAYRNEKEFGFELGDNTYGYDNVFRFRNMSDLINQMRAERLRGRVWRLAIVAHGDSPGVVRLEENRDLSFATLGQFHTLFNRLKHYLTVDATFMFVSCIAGTGREGTDLLVGISSLLPTRYVVGFTQWGVSLASGLNMPGAIYQSGSPVPIFHNPQAERLDVNSRFAKIARDGQIIQEPAQSDQA